MKRRIEERWKSFESHVLSATAGETQRRDMKVAFFAGAVSLWDIMMSGVSDTLEHTAEDDALGNELVAEMHAFAETVKPPEKTGEKTP